MNNLINDIVVRAQAEILKKTGKHVVLHVSENPGIKELKELCIEICNIWGVEFSWLCNGRRSEQRPIMKKVIWMILKNNFPKTPLICLASVLGNRDHASVIHGLEAGKIWLDNNDERFMKYYNQVKHFINEPELVN